MRLMASAGELRLSAQDRELGEAEKTLPRELGGDESTIGSNTYYMEHRWHETRLPRWAIGPPSRSCLNRTAPDTARTEEGAAARLGRAGARPHGASSTHADDRRAQDTSARRTTVRSRSTTRGTPVSASAWSTSFARISSARRTPADPPTARP